MKLSLMIMHLLSLTGLLLVIAVSCLIGILMHLIIITISSMLDDITLLPYY